MLHRVLEKLLAVLATETDSSAAADGFNALGALFAAVPVGAQVPVGVNLGEILGGVLSFFRNPPTKCFHVASRLTWLQYMTCTLQLY